MKATNLLVIYEPFRRVYPNLPRGGEALFWSSGARAFVSLSEADVYFRSDKKKIQLPRGGNWMDLSDAIVKVQVEAAGAQE
jgi:hypothetical protein